MKKKSYSIFQKIVIREIEAKNYYHDRQKIRNKTPKNNSTTFTSISTFKIGPIKYLDYFHFNLIMNGNTESNV